MTSKLTPFISTDYRDSEQVWDEPLRADTSSPNVVVVVLDDIGFAQLGCYGSDIATPSIDALAANGLRFTNFHTTALCSPTRAALLTGRNHHSNHVGAVGELATGFPGYDMRMPAENGTMAEVLRDQGYATFAVGKWHLTPAEEGSMAAPRDRWPLGKGFERFYGFLGAETNQYSPELVYDNHQIPTPEDRDGTYHLSEDLVDKSIEFIRDVTNVAPDKPFFLYLAFGACHVPHHVPDSYIEQYEGKFERGWDDWRERVYRRQLDEGIIPAGTLLSERPEWIPAWDSLASEEQEVYTRLMEVFAAFVEHTDAQIGRLMNALQQMERGENTVVVVVSDNGASPEGGQNGTFNNARYLNAVPETIEDIRAHIDDLGGPDAYNHYPFGWAWAGNTPLKRWKQETHEGGIACPLVISWPERIKEKGLTRHQYTHAIDVFPTLLDALGHEYPKRIRGVSQSELHGTSFARALTDADFVSRRRIQYYEVRGCRAIYEDGWKAVAYHPRVNLAWDGSDALRPYSEDTWELYNVAEDFSECRDLSSSEPDRLARMIERWFVEAGKYNVLPLDNRGVARIGLRKPQLSRRSGKYIFYPSTAGIREHAAVNLRNRSHRVTARVDYQAGDQGVILAQGTAFAGWSIFVQDGRLNYCYNYAAFEHYHAESAGSIPRGATRLELQYEAGANTAAQVTLFVDGNNVGSVDVPNTLAITFGTGGDQLYVGRDEGSAVCSVYAAPNVYSGRLHDVVVVVGEEPLVDPLQAEFVAEARQ